MLPSEMPKHTKCRWSIQDDLGDYYCICPTVEESQEPLNENKCDNCSYFYSQIEEENIRTSDKFSEQLEF